MRARNKMFLMYPVMSTCYSFLNKTGDIERNTYNELCFLTALVKRAKTMPCNEP